MGRLSKARIERGQVAPPSEKTIVRIAGELGEDPDVLLALAGRVSSELQGIIRKRPRLFARLLRELEDMPDWGSHPRYPVAVKVAAGKINAVSGEQWRKGLHRDPQDYLPVPDQPWLDGHSRAPVVRPLRCRQGRSPTPSPRPRHDVHRDAAFSSRLAGRSP